MFNIPKNKMKEKSQTTNLFSGFFGKEKKAETIKIKNYNQAMKIIKFFIATYEWEKARKALDEILEKENISYSLLIKQIEETPENYFILKEKNKINAKYKEKQREIEELSYDYEKRKEKYDNSIDNKRFTLRFENIKKETNHLAKSGKANEALKLLGKFLEENPGNKFVISLYNKEKKFILSQLEKEKIAEEVKLKQNAQIEALKLIGETVSQDLLDEQKEKEDKKGNIFSKIKEIFNFYKKIKKNRARKRLIDEITLLLEEEDKVKNQIASAKLENIHKGLIKEISKENMIGYNLYGKILGAHKISGDTFGFNEIKNKYTFFIGDATGHGIRAGFIITLLTRLFSKFVEKGDIKKLIYEINNGLKQDLKSMNFITGIFFEVFKEDPNKLKFVGLGHEPILVYRSKTKTIEKIIPGGLAAGIRIIKDEKNIKVNEIEMGKDDVLLTYSDGIIECKSLEGEFYSINRLIETFKKVASLETDIKKIYDFIIKDATMFRGGANFDDDLTILILKRDLDKDIISDREEFLKEIGEFNTMSRGDIRKLKGITKKEIQIELEKIKKANQLKRVIKRLEQLWLTGEMLKLKSEARRYIKEGYIHTKINYYLKKAIDNAEKYKISLKEERISNKYNIIKEILKKGDYDTVIKEAEDIISKDGNI